MYRAFIGNRYQLFPDFLGKITMQGNDPFEPVDLAALLFELCPAFHTIACMDFIMSDFDPNAIDRYLFLIGIHPHRHHRA